MPADRSGAAESAFDHVANFYGAYIDARGSASEELGQELRRHYLTADLRGRLAAWEGRHAPWGTPGRECGSPGAPGSRRPTTGTAWPRGLWATWTAIRRPR
ncbi:hypothetical protein GCM10010246_83280 [Streptomyces cuspidosporus]|uniref:Uncharacterized protein n=1 Tax=Streptomyces cuspidosporus TaxID=66882 RepID=A0ABN3HC78_9ACTN